MIPGLRNGRLPAGVHRANWVEVKEAFGWNDHRRGLLDGFRRGVNELHRAGCRSVWLDGSFVTEVDVPSDFDACWDTTGVNPAKLDPILLDIDGERLAQKLKYGGEFLPNAPASGFFFLHFFQFDRDGDQKGIVQLDLWEWNI